MSSVGEELKHNQRLNKSKEEFVQIMKNLGLAKPKKMSKLELFSTQCLSKPVTYMYC